MLQSFLSLVSGAKSWVKGLVLVLAVFGAAVLGYTLAARGYKADIAQMQADYSARAQEQAEQNLKKERESAEKLSAAIAARDAALRDLDASRGDADGLRNELAAYERKLSSAGAGACEFERKRLAGCVRLLSEGSGLAAEGARLAQRIAVDKDAIAAIK